MVLLFGYLELGDDYMIIAGFVKHLSVLIPLKRPIGRPGRNFRATAGNNFSAAIISGRGPELQFDLVHISKKLKKIV